MKKIRVMVLFAVMAGLLFMGSVMSPGGIMTGMAFAAAQTKCPVLSGDVDKKIFVDYKGQRIYFCCSGCIEKFKSDPEKYLKQMQAEGITPEKTPAK